MYNFPYVVMMKNDYFVLTFQIDENWKVFLFIVLKLLGVEIVKLLTRRKNNCIKNLFKKLIWFLSILLLTYLDKKFSTERWEVFVKILTVWLTNLLLSESIISTVFVIVLYVLISGEATTDCDHCGWVQPLKNLSWFWSGTFVKEILCTEQKDFVKSHKWITFLNQHHVYLQSF